MATLFQQNLQKCLNLTTHCWSSFQDEAMKGEVLKLKLLSVIGILPPLPCRNFLAHTTNKSVDNKYSLSNILKSTLKWFILKSSKLSTKL